MSISILLRTIPLVATLLVLSSCDTGMDLYGSPDPTSMVDGVVLYGDDGIVADVEVTLQEEVVFQTFPTVLKTTRTDSQGRFRFDFAHDGDHIYHAAVKGLYSSSKEFKVSLRPGENQDIVLRYYRSP